MSMTHYRLNDYVKDASTSVEGQAARLAFLLRNLQVGDRIVDRRDHSVAVVRHIGKQRLTVRREMWRGRPAYQGYQSIRGLEEGTRRGRLYYQPVGAPEGVDECYRIDRCDVDLHKLADADGFGAIPHYTKHGVVVSHHIGGLVKATTWSAGTEYTSGFQRNGVTPNDGVETVLWRLFEHDGWQVKGYTLTERVH